MNHDAPTPDPAGPTEVLPVQRRRKRWHQRWLVRIPLAALALLIGITALGAAVANQPVKAITVKPSPAITVPVPTPPAPVHKTAPTHKATQPPASSAPASQAPAPAHTTKPPAPAPAGPTVSQQQALGSAQSYLSDGQGFSRQGLIDQLSSNYGEKFSVADATWAVDHSGANWDDQAVLSAKGYMSDGQGFSRSGLIDQLTSPYGEKFTYNQASYAAGKVGL